MKKLHVFVTALALSLAITSGLLVSPAHADALSNTSPDVVNISNNIGNHRICRLKGANRYETSANIAVDRWSSATNAILAGCEGDNSYPDSLASVTLACRLRAPILLTATNSTPQCTIDALKKLGVKDITIVGGNAVVSEQQQENLKKLGYQVKRISGPTRYDTANKIAEECAKYGDIGNVAIATSTSFQNILITAPTLARFDTVFIYVDGDTLSDEQRNIIASAKNKCFLTIDGSTCVSQNLIQNLLNAGYSDVGATSHDYIKQSQYTLINDKGTKDPKNICVASGKAFPDALSMAPYAALANADMVLVNNSFEYKLPEKYKNFYIAGGYSAVSENVVKQMIEKL